MSAQQDSIDLVRSAAAAAERIGAADPIVYDVSVPMAICDAMLIVSSSNERQTLAIADEIEKDVYLRGGGREPRDVEGRDQGRWVLLDYGDVLIHVMLRDVRDFYGLERLWGDCPEIVLGLPYPVRATDAGGAGDGVSDASIDDGGDGHQDASASDVATADVRPKAPDD